MRGDNRDVSADRNRNGLRNLSEAELEAMLLRLSRSRQSGTAIQAKTAALRTLLKRRQHERRAAERAEAECRRREADAAEVE
jgi:hypothetical protein